MKTKSKSSKNAGKKPASKKKITSTVRKKRVAAKSVKKAAPAKKTRKASPGKTAKRPVAKKQAATNIRKKKSTLKPVKRSAAKKKPVPAEAPIPVIQETIFSIAEITPGDALPSAPLSVLLVGRVTDYDNDSNVAIIELDAGNLQVGDTIHIKGHTTDFEQVVDSIEIEQQNFESAEAGQTVGVKVRDVVREHDKVHKKRGR